MSFHAEVWDGLVKGPGLYLGIPAERYHADPTPEPSLSASVAKIAWEKSLRKAKEAHPRLRSPDYPEDPQETDVTPPWYVEVGRAAHTLTLGAGAEPVWVSYSNWRTKDAREERDAIYKEGRIPLLKKHYDLAERMAKEARPFIKELFGAETITEAMICSQENGFWRRSLIDVTSVDLRRLGDFKTTSRDMSPLQASRAVSLNGNEFQASFYTRNADALDPDGIGRREFYFVFQEVEYPHELSVVFCDEALKSQGDIEVENAIRLWDRAMKTGNFPGYDRKPYSVGPENWAIRRLEDRLAMDESLREDAP